MHKIEYNDFSNEKNTAELDKIIGTDYTRAKQRIYSDRWSCRGGEVSRGFAAPLLTLRKSFVHMVNQYQEVLSIVRLQGERKFSTTL